MNEQAEAAPLVVEVMTAHAQVCQYAVYLFVPVVEHPVLQEAEVAAPKGEPLVLYGPLHGIQVLVETV